MAGILRKKEGYGKKSSNILFLWRPHVLGGVRGKFRGKERRGGSHKETWGPEKRVLAGGDLRKNIKQE